MASSRKDNLLRPTITTTFLHLLPLLFLPFTLTLLLLLRLQNYLRPRHLKLPSPTTSPRRKVLLTGPPSAALLTLSRIFTNAGHIVIAASAEPVSYASPLRFARSISAFHRLGPDGTCEQDILRLIVAEGIDLWIPVDYGDGEFGDHRKRRERTEWVKEILDLEARRSKPRFVCKTLVPEEAVLRLCRDDVAFARFVEDLDTEMEGRRVLEVRTRGELHGVLNAERRGRRYVVERMEVDDRKELDGLRIEFGEEEGVEREVLPRETMNETYHIVSRLQISLDSPWVMKEVPKVEALVARGLVVNGKVMAFAVTKPVYQPSPGGSGPRKIPKYSFHDTLSNCASQIVSPSDPIYPPLQNFMAAFLAKLTSSPSTFLSISFYSQTKFTTTGTTTNFRPFICSTIPCPQYFCQHGTSSLADAYLSILNPSAKTTLGHQVNEFADGHTTPPRSSSPHLIDDKHRNSPIAGAELTPPRTPERSTAKSVPDTPKPTNSLDTLSMPFYQRHPSSTPAIMPPASEVKGVYNLSTTIWLSILLPLRLLLLQRSWNEVHELMRGLLVVGDRVLNWEVEGWAWEDFGVVFWEWGVLRPLLEVMAVVGVVGAGWREKGEWGVVS
ncbi:hypothetical protein K490DRAFT_53546 [Saccharata proteae CBS 121410]|uniref:Uncharacterized protein n=1 Tax=Saccharata proteae CBS 121410 TaxID=1314787 RepID=A0A9P4HWM5_9PEZI|nr:hypothetical protein K490DRAFT_53546 [Saccharata proteae CBS 121410]